MRWKEAAAHLGTGTLVGGLKALESQLSKRQFKRILATTVAQLLELHPDLGARKARRYARKVTGARPWKKVLRPGNAATAKEALGAVAATAATVAGAKLAERLASKLGDQRSDAHDQTRPDGREHDTADSL